MALVGIDNQCYQRYSLECAYMCILAFIERAAVQHRKVPPTRLFLLACYNMFAYNITRPRRRKYPAMLVVSDQTHFFNFELLLFC